LPYSAKEDLAETKTNRNPTEKKGRMRERGPTCRMFNRLYCQYKRKKQTKSGKETSGM